MTVTIIEGPRKVGKSTYLRHNGFKTFKEKSAYLLGDLYSSNDSFCKEILHEPSYFYGKDIGVLQTIPFFQDGTYIDRLFFSSIVYGCLNRDLDYSQMVESYRKLISELDFEFSVLLMLHTKESLEKTITISRGIRYLGDDSFEDTFGSLEKESKLFEDLYDDFKDLIHITKIEPFIMKPIGYKPS